MPRVSRLQRKIQTMAQAAQAATAATRYGSDSEASGYVAKAEPGSDAFKTKVAEPTMQAIDQMPKCYRLLVHEFGYVDVFRAWRRGWSPDRIRGHAKDGIFRLD